MERRKRGQGGWRPPWTNRGDGFNFITLLGLSANHLTRQFGFQFQIKLPRIEGDPLWADRPFSGYQLFFIFQHPVLYHVEGSSATGKSAEGLTRRGQLCWDPRHHRNEKAKIHHLQHIPAEKRDCGGLRVFLCPARGDHTTKLMI